MKVFDMCPEGVSEWVAAPTREDAIALYCQMTGFPPEGSDDWNPEGIAEVSPNALKALRFADSEGDFGPAGGTLTFEQALAIEAARHPAGEAFYLACEDY